MNEHFSLKVFKRGKLWFFTAYPEGLRIPYLLPNQVSIFGILNRWDKYLYDVC